MLDAARDGQSWKMDLANLEQMHQLIVKIYYLKINIPNYSPY